VRELLRQNRRMQKSLGEIKAVKVRAEAEVAALQHTAIHCNTLQHAATHVAVCKKAVLTSRQ